MSLLLLENVKKAYRAPSGSLRPVLAIPRLELAVGEQAALAGASGAGKSTLLHLIAGILPADEGRILLDGVDLARLSEAARDRVRLRKIGVVFQSFQLLDGYSALENVELAMLFGTGRNRSRARELLHRMGLEARLGDSPRRLSLGEQQRVAVARALANEPRLVLADEPTSHLDPENARTAVSLLREVCRERNAALLLAAHDPAALEGFGRVERLENLNRPLPAKEPA